jgi:hypothetical protein
MAPSTPSGHNRNYDDVTRVWHFWSGLPTTAPRLAAGQVRGRLSGM